MSDIEEMDEEGDLIDGLMMVTLYDNFFTLTIFSYIFPTLFIMEDLDSDDKYQTIDKIDNFISRIANYYKYNKMMVRSKLEVVYASTYQILMIQSFKKKCQIEH